MNPGDVIALLFVAAMVGLALWLALRRRKKGGCSGCCDSCGGCRKQRK